MKLIFMGTPQLAVPHLDALIEEHKVLCVVTQPDKPVRRGREMVLTPSPVKLRAQELDIPVLQPERARNPEFVEELRAFKAEAIAVVAYGQILPQSLLDLPLDNHPHGGCVNMHFSLLPRWRGAAPAQYAIWHGDAQTGVTTQFMVAKLDAGDVIVQRPVPIEPEETSGELLERLTPIGAEVLRETLQLMEQGRTTRTPQDEAGVTLCPQIDKEMARIAWNRAAREIHNQIRAFNPWPTAWCEWRGEPVKIWTARVEEKSLGNPGTIHVGNDAVRVSTADGTLRLIEIQPAGKPKLNPLDWARGARLESGAKFD
jgi:methionyl-tRNA formyltransferase